MPSEAERIVAAAKANGADRIIELIHFRDLMEPNLTSAELVEDLITAGSVALIYGPPGCGKTFLVLDMVLSIAQKWNDEWFERWVRKGRVVYVAAEAGQTIRNRIAAWTTERLGLAKPDEVEFEVVMSPVDLCHRKKGDVERLVLAIGACQVVVIDTVSRAMGGGDENGPDDMGAFITALDLLRHQLGTTVIAVHHTGKDEGRGSRGHSSLACAADTWIEVDKRDLGVSVATVVRQRDGPGGGQIAFSLRQVVLGENERGKPVTSCVVDPADFVPDKATMAPKPLGGQAKAALDLLRQAIMEKGETADGVCRVPMEVWKGYMEKSKKPDGLPAFGDGAAFRNAWKRAHEKLGELGHVSFGDGYAWVNGADDSSHRGRDEREPY
jgi:KaiC/GvpD/RAD55 family RecA-like ATPase